MSDSVTTEKAPDPYWSLWGRLKAQHRRDEADERRVQEAGQTGGLDEVCVIEEVQSRPRTPLRLPHRPYKVEYNGVSLIVGGVAKTITSDAHAVNTLRKLDTDDTYLAHFLSAAQE